MKKLSLLLSTLLFVGCSSQNISTQNINKNQTPKFSANKSPSITAKTAYPIALKEVKKLFSKPLLFEIDVWKESNSDKIHFGFMQKNTNDSYKFIRVIIDRKTSKISHETINKGSKIPVLVDLDHWKLDHNDILKTAQTNGLRDKTFLATLWENTWHISGLKQHLYFQINSQNGKVKMRCIGPYLNQCTDGDLNPITKKISSDFQKKRNLLK